MTSNCRGCKRVCELSELQEWPFVCKRCLDKHFTQIVRAQEESIKFWQQTLTEGCRGERIEAPRERWSKSIREGLRRLGV